MGMGSEENRDWDLGFEGCGEGREREKLHISS